jgi:hypothetical protein
MATFVIKLDLWLLPLVIFLVIIIYAIYHVTFYDYVLRKKRVLLLQLGNIIK